MPSFVVVFTPCRVGQTVPAEHCDLTAARAPNRKNSVAVKIRLASDQLLYVEDEPRSVIQTIGLNGKTTFLVTGTTQGLRNADRCRELAQTSALLDKLRDCLLPLKNRQRGRLIGYYGSGRAVPMARSGARTFAVKTEATH